MTAISILPAPALLTNPVTFRFDRSSRPGT
jgi:hypothetical protein